MQILTILLQLAGGLAIFMYGMEKMSDGIQRAAGERLQNALNFMTGNRVMAVLTGTLITVIIQSSSATTVMCITFVNAGLLSLSQGIGVIMGANIGTTVTAWIVAAVGIADLSLSVIAIPMFGIGYFMSISKRRSDAFRSYGVAIQGLAFIFLGLGFISHAIPRPTADTLLFLERFSDMGFLAVLGVTLIGVAFTVIVHSSSAAMAVVITLALQGVINFEFAAALTLGANIGTTVDAFLATLTAGANANAKRAGWAHILFNIFGTVWVLVILKPFIAFIDMVVPGAITPQTIGIHIAMLHTIFNVANTLIFLPFVKPYARFLENLIKEKPEDAEKRAIYRPRALMATPELSLLHARAEIASMAGVARSMFARVRAAFAAEPGDIESEIEWFAARENYADGMHEELSKYLISITTLDLSERTRSRVGKKLRIISELESMTDECLSIAFLLKKKSTKGLQFDPESLAALTPFSSLVDESLEFVSARLNVGLSEVELGMAREMEDKIDLYKKHLKKLARKRLKRGADVKSELLYIDLIRHVEKMGDCAYAIAGELRQFSQ